MAEAASLLEKYGNVKASDDSSELHQQILDFQPEWEKYEATKGQVTLLKLLEVDAPAIKTKAIMMGHTPIVQACLEAVTMQDEMPAKWILTLFYDMIREDSSSYSVFENALKSQISIYKPLMTLLGRSCTDSYLPDKAAWLLSAVMGNLPRFFTDDDVKSLLTTLLEPTTGPCSDLGKLEAITNLLKSDIFRSLVWSAPGVCDLIFRVQPKTAPSPYLYKCVFATWMLSFDSAITADLKNYGVVKKIREILTYSRVEKVVRLCLTVLKNLLSHKVLCEDIVEEGVLEAVQQLEYEKWRDSDLYDDIRDMVTLISSEVQEMSNFDRYERELQSGTLQWGFIHSSKFWAENVMKFESNDFRALRMLASLLLTTTTDTTTLAVACHDLGEFVALHPLGKKKVAQLQVKERVMQLMGSSDASYREVRREALLCCQKIMLHKWQDMEQPK